MWPSQIIWTLRKIAILKIHLQLEKWKVGKYLLKNSSGAQWYQFSKSILHLRGDFKNGVENTKPSSDVHPVRIGIFLSNKPSFMACSKGMGINGSFDSGSKLGFHCSGFGTSQALKRVVPSTKAM